MIVNFGNEANKIHPVNIDTKYIVKFVIGIMTEEDAKSCKFEYDNIDLREPLKVTAADGSEKIWSLAKLVPSIDITKISVSLLSRLGSQSIFLALRAAACQSNAGEAFLDNILRRDGIERRGSSRFWGKSTTNGEQQETFSSPPLTFLWALTWHPQYS
jgi:hypothetical protein